MNPADLESPWLYNSNSTKYDLVCWHQKIKTAGSTEPFCIFLTKYCSYCDGTWIFWKPQVMLTNPFWKYFPTPSIYAHFWSIYHYLSAQGPVAIRKFNFWGYYSLFMLWQQFWAPAIYGKPKKRPKILEYVRLCLSPPRYPLYCTGYSNSYKVLWKSG